MVKTYKIGQILYVIPAENATIVPVQVLERRIIESVNGQAVKHVVKSPKPQAKPIVLETIKGAIFGDLKTARDIMVKNAIAAIDAMIDNANQIAKKAFHVERQDLQDQIDGDVFESDDMHHEHITEQRLEQQHKVHGTEHEDVSELAEIMLPDGTKQLAKLKVAR